MSEAEYWKQRSVFTKEIDHWKGKYEEMRASSQVNFHFASEYENALRQIAKLCGHDFSVNQTNPFPDKSIDDIAIEAVEKMIQRAK